MPTNFCPQGGHCKEVQLYLWQLLVASQAKYTWMTLTRVLTGTVNVIDRSVPEIDNSTTLSRKNTSRYWYVQWQLFNYVPPDFGKCEHHTLSGEWVQ